MEIITRWNFETKTVYISPVDCEHHKKKFKVGTSLVKLTAALWLIFFSLMIFASSFYVLS